MNINKLIFQTVLFIPFILLLTGCENDDNQSAPNRNYQLVWEDNFDGPENSSPDTTNWNFEIGTGIDGWGNQELQYYTDRPENIELDGNGHLVITARAEQFAGSGFTSARINTLGKFSQAYGRFEARIRTTYGPGLWPAFWMLGDNFTTDGWPQCGEIDIMEQRGQAPDQTVGSVHGPGYSGGAAISGYYALESDRFDKDFHVYAVEWGEDYIDYYVDDFLFNRITPKDLTGEWVFNQPFFILLNVAVGGTFVGFPVPETPFPQTMEVDYVRVYAEQR